VVPTEIISPTFKKERYPCPFYGFNIAMMGALMDIDGNGCALKVGSFSPCQMEAYQKQTPDWRKCPFNSESNRDAIEKIIQKCTIYPNEFFPAGAKSWKGMPLDVWVGYVMGQGEARQ